MTVLFLTVSTYDIGALARAEGPRSTELDVARRTGAGRRFADERRLEPVGEGASTA
jgi:hypothetical protein